MRIKGKDFIIKSSGVYYRYSTTEDQDGSLVIMDVSGLDFTSIKMSKEKAEEVISQIVRIQESVANPDLCLIDLEELINNTQ